MTRALLIVALLLPAAARAGPVTVAAEARRLAVTVGVQQFDDDGWPELRFTERDAQAMADHLSASAGFATTVHTGAATTRADILGTLDELARTITSPRDNVVLYFSTHGTLARTVGGDLEQVLVLRDTDKSKPLETGLLVRDLIDRFEALPSARKVLILATCYSGAGKSSLGDSVQRYLGGLKGSPAQPLYEVSRATVVLSASAWGETAREDEGLGHDIYTHFLLKALDGFDPNGDGATSVTEAHDFARRQTYAFTDGRQRPTAILTVEGEDPIVLSGERTRDGNPVLLAYADHLSGLVVRVDGTDKGELPGGIVVEPGWHEVSVGDWSGRLRLSPGERLSLERVIAAEPPRRLLVTLGAGWLPGADIGESLVPVGLLTVAGHLDGWPASWLDLSLRISLGVGRDHWVINQERFGVDLLAARVRVGCGTHWEIGRLGLHLDLLAGAMALHQSPDSRFYASARVAWSADLGAGVTARLRLGRSASVGLSVAGGALLGDRNGPWADIAAVGGWSF